LKTAYFVIGIAALLIFFSIMRLFGYEVPVLVIALFSIVAALTSISDLLEIIKVKKGQNVPLILALIFFVGALFIWIADFSFKSKYMPRLGDCFTIFGLGLVIGIFGFKEIPTKKTLGLRHYKNIQLEIISYDHKKMLELSDTVEELNRIDNQTIVALGKVHDGWGLFYGILSDYIKNSDLFMDGLHQKLFYEFYNEVDEYAELLANASNPNVLHRAPEIYLTLNENKDKLNLYNISGVQHSTIKEQAEICLKSWGILKDTILKNYTTSRSRFKNT